MASLDVICQTCRFFVSDGAWGQCRRLPPVVTHWQDKTSSHPLVRAGHWCGEHQQVQPSQE